MCLWVGWTNLSVFIDWLALVGLPECVCWLFRETWVCLFTYWLVWPECLPPLKSCCALWTALQPMGDNFVCGYIQQMDGEKDPRNLMLAFQCSLFTCRNFPLGNVAATFRSHILTLLSSLRKVSRKPKLLDTVWCCCCFYLLYILTLCDLFT